MAAPHIPGLLQALLDAIESATLGCTVLIEREEARLERVYVNEEFARVVGVDLDAARTMPPMAMFSAEERDRLTAIRASFSGVDGPRFLETTVVRPDGTSIPVELAMGYTALDGSRAVFIFVRDVSAKAAMAAALRESEERFRRVAESSPDSITVYAQGKYIYANPVALKHLGVGPDEDLSTVDPWARVPPERRDEVAAYTQRLRIGEVSPPLNHRLRGPDGHDQFLESSLSLTSLGGAPAIVSYTRDITERVRLQAELMKQDRLASLGVLAAGVAHELSNPLTSLGIEARKLREASEKDLQLSTEAKASLAQIDEAARRMKSIIADLLFMARPAEKPQTHVDVAQIIVSTIALMRAGTPSCPPVHAHLGDLVPVQGYASKLGQVVFNVLRNAVQAVEGKGGGDVHVHASVVGDEIVIVVEDDGVGIPAETLPHVTQPFFTTKADGTGLGLWISQTLMAHHGGTLDLKSDEGAGTKVTLRLPTRQAQERLARS
ncbi:MAG: PAS domain S-box protein [Labilithrix sp.]|nr:PAS domain S-box protein [Labilithrix sp.]